MATQGPFYHPDATAEAIKTVGKHQDPEDIKLWAGWFCPFTHRVWICLEEKQISYQYKEVNPYHKDKDFLAISPKGLVPAIEVEKGALHDSAIICEYLGDAFPEAVTRLLPKDPYDKATARIWMDFSNKSIVPAFFRLLQAQHHEEKRQATALAELNQALETLSSKRRGRYFFGDEISLVDIFIAPWAVRDFIIRDHRHFNRDNVAAGWKMWAEALESRPSVVATTSDPERYLEFNRTFLENESHSVPAIAAMSGQAIP